MEPRKPKRRARRPRTFTSLLWISSSCSGLQLCRSRPILCQQAQLLRGHLTRPNLMDGPPDTCSERRHENAKKRKCKHLRKRTGHKIKHTLFSDRRSRPSFSISLSLYLSMSLYPSIHPSIHPFINLSIYLCFDPSISPIRLDPLNSHSSPVCPSPPTQKQEPRKALLQFVEWACSEQGREAGCPDVDPSRVFLFGFRSLTTCFRLCYPKFPSPQECLTPKIALTAAMGQRAGLSS